MRGGANGQGSDADGGDADGVRKGGKTSDLDSVQSDGPYAGVSRVKT